MHIIFLLADTSLQQLQSTSTNLLPSAGES